MPLILLLLLPLLAARPAAAEEFTGEVYLVGTSVADNGTSGALPSRIHTATQYLDFPGDFGPYKLFRLEGATLPSFGGLSQNVSGALSWALDSLTRMNVFAGILYTSGIERRPILRGTPQDRINDPSFRPVECEDCYGSLINMVSQANINFMRKYRGYVPRIGIGSRPIPLEASIGATTKYYYEELWDGGYEAQNLNMDLGACLKLMWGWDPVARRSDRDIKVQVSGFEVLPTRQRALVNDYEVYEKMENRWSLSLAWEEGLPWLDSFLSLGLTQRSIGGDLPDLGIEWDLKRQLYLRGGWDGEFLSAGASVAWRFMSVHYAFRHHELGNSVYQVSAQVEWP